MDGGQDVLSFGSEPRWRPPRRPVVVTAFVALVGVVLAAVAVLGLGDRRGSRPAVAPVATPTLAPGVPDAPPCLPVGWAQRPPVVRPVAGLRIDQAAAGPGSALERCDRTAARGPLTVVVRRRDGSLGRHGAVVTFPVGPPGTGRRVAVGGVTGTAVAGAVVWPVAGAHARVRGDLTPAELVAIAARTTVVAGRPAVRPPRGFAVTASGPYRPPAVHELRYGSVEVGEGAALGGGLTYTGVASGGGFEDRLYAVRATGGGVVRGRPAVVSAVSGGNATLAWEPAPGLVAYVGYSGAPVDGRAVAALRRLAERATALDAGQWTAGDPQTVDQVNEPG